MGKKQCVELKLKLNHINQAYKIIRSYLITCEMMGFKPTNSNEIETYRYFKSVLKKYKRALSKTKLFYKINFDEDEDLI